MIRSLVQGAVLVSLLFSGLQAFAQCPSGFTSVPKNGNAIGFETNSVNAPQTALGPLDLNDNQSGLFSPTNAPFLDQAGQFLTLNFGELITPGSPVTMSLGFFSNTASKMLIETSADGVNYTLLGYYGASTATGLGASDFRSTYGSQVADHFTFNAPAGGIRRMKFTFQVGTSYVDGVRYQSVCRPAPSLTCDPVFTPAVAAYAQNGNTSNGSGVENAAGALILNYPPNSLAYPDGFGLVFDGTNTGGAGNMAGIPGGGTEALIADLGTIVDKSKYIIMNLAGYKGASGTGRKIEISFSTTTTFQATPDLTLGNNNNPTVATLYFTNQNLNYYWIPVPDNGVRYIRIIDRGTNFGGPDSYLDFIGYTCAPGPYDFGDLPDGTAGNNGSDFTTKLSNNGPRHEWLSPPFGNIPRVYLNNKPLLEFNANVSLEADGDGNEEALAYDVINPTATSYSISAAKLTGINTTGLTANVYAWLDLNQNGIFESTEIATTTFAGGATTAAGALTWNNLPALPGLRNPELALRIRITSSTLSDTGGTTQDERSIGLATDGEVEDYIIPVTQVSLTCYLCNSSGFAVGGSPSSFYKVDLRTGARTLVKDNITGDNKYTITALGFNEAAGEFWGIARGTNKMVKITSRGAVTYEDFTNLPANKNWEAGDIYNGLFYLHSGAAGDNLLYIVDLATKAVTTRALISNNNVFAPFIAADFGPINDLAVNPLDGKIYYASSGDTPFGFARGFYQIDPLTGNVINLGNIPNKEEVIFNSFKNE